MGLPKGAQTITGMKGRTGRFAKCVRSWAIGSIILVLGFSHFQLQAQGDSLSGLIRVHAIGALQRPTGLHLEGVDSRYQAGHFFFGLSYQLPFSPRYRLGAGAGLSWGTYCVGIKGQVTDSSGTAFVSNTQWSPFVWYPFTRGFVGPNAWSTDPIQLWLEGVRVFRKSEANSWWEITATVGAALPTGIYLSQSTEVQRDPNTWREPAVTFNAWGDSWYAMIGLAAERIFQLKNRDRICVGLDWRYSLQPYFDQELTLHPLTSNAQTVEAHRHFFWLGVRVGYDFAWGFKHKPKWMRLQEERGVAQPRNDKRSDKRTT